jgi:hypothetical protein
MIQHVVDVLKQFVGWENFLYFLVGMLVFDMIFYVVDKWDEFIGE